MRLVNRLIDLINGKTYDDYLEDVMKDGNALAFVPAKMRGRDICMAAVMRSPTAIAYVPEELRDTALCTEAVARNPIMMRFVPKKAVDRSMLAAILANHPEAFALDCMPERMFDKDVIVEAAVLRPDVIWWMPENIPDRKQVCIEAVRANPAAFWYFPGSLRDREACMEIVKDYADVMDFIPESLRDRELCLEAVAKNGLALEFVPEALRDREMCMAAVKSNPYALEFVPGELVDMEMRVEAVTCHPEVLGQDDAPRQLLDRDVVAKYLDMFPLGLEHVPGALRDRRMCMEAVRQDARALEFVPEWMFDKEMFFAGITSQRASYHAMDSFPRYLIDDEMKQVLSCMKNLHSVVAAGAPPYLTDKGECIAFVKENGLLPIYGELLGDKDVIMEAMKRDGTELRFVPYELRDKDVCEAAIHSSQVAVRWIPDDVCRSVAMAIPNMDDDDDYAVPLSDDTPPIPDTLIPSAAWFPRERSEPEA